MKGERRHYVFLGLSITSTWGNGHATTYRGLVKELAARGHRITFLERDVPWYSANREFETLPYCDVFLYSGMEELRDRSSDLMKHADAVIVGSYVPDGIAIGRWVKKTAKNLVAFYDIDTPVTLAALRAGTCEYLTPDLVSKYDLYLSFTGGPTLKFIERELGSSCARPLYCSVDPSLYFPEPTAADWELAYLGTYAEDRQATVESLFLEVARQLPDKAFAIAGPQYPEKIVWPTNVRHIEHLSAAEHRHFYNRQHFALNVTRRDMIRAGYSPSVRLFEAAACGVPILTDRWVGLSDFFEPGKEIIPVGTTGEVREALTMPAAERKAIAERARKRALRFHTAAVRAAEFEGYMSASLCGKTASKNASVVRAERTAADMLSVK